MDMPAHLETTRSVRVSFLRSTTAAGSITASRARRFHTDRPCHKTLGAGPCATPHREAAQHSTSLLQQCCTGNGHGTRGPFNTTMDATYYDGQGRQQLHLQ